MPRKGEIIAPTTYVVIERTRPSGLRLKDEAAEMGMKPRTLRAGTHKGPGGTEITIGKGNVGLVFTKPREIEEGVPALIQANTNGLEGERQLAEGDRLGAIGGTLFGQALSMTRRAGEMTAEGRRRVDQSSRYREMMARLLSEPPEES